MKLHKKQMFAALGDVDDRFVDESALPEEEAVTERPKRRHAVAAFFEKPAVVAAVCAIVALGTVAGIMAAGQAAGEPVPPIGGTVNGDSHLQETVNGETDPQEQETDFAYIVRHDDLYYISHGNGTCSLVGIAALPEDMVLTIPETAMNGDRVVSLQDMTMTSSLAVPNGVHLSQVKGIHIPASMTSVHIKTLHEMTALESLTVDEDNPVYRAEGNGLIERDRERLVYIYPSTVVMPPPLTQSAMSLHPLSTFVIPDSVKIIGINALNYTIEKIYLDDVLSGAIPLYKTTQIHIPASVEQIEERFFVNHDYSSIDISVNENNPVYYAEGNCLIHKESNTVILGGKNAKIPDGVTAIAPYAFWGAGLKSIHIPASVQSIGELAFWNNPHLTVITGDICAMPKAELDLDADSTFSCYYVEDHCLIRGEMQVKDGILTTTHTLVLGCASSVIPAQTTAIGDFAFAWNEGLTEIDLPAKLQSIGFKAFAHCPYLMTIRYDNTYESWCQVAVDDTWIYDNGQMTALYFTDMEIPLTVIGVEPNPSGQGKTES